MHRQGGERLTHLGRKCGQWLHRLRRFGGRTGLGHLLCVGPLRHRRQRSLRRWREWLGRFRRLHWLGRLGGLLVHVPCVGGQLFRKECVHRRRVRSDGRLFRLLKMRLGHRGKRRRRSGNGGRESISENISGQFFPVRWRHSQTQMHLAHDRKALSTGNVADAKPRIFRDRQRQGVKSNRGFTNKSRSTLIPSKSSEKSPTALTFESEYSLARKQGKMTRSTLQIT